MTSVRIRPRFKTESEKSPEEILQRLKRKTEESKSPCTGVFIPEHVTLKIKPEDAHFWSPQLGLRFYKEEDEPLTQVRGLYGPNPTIWAIIAFGYGASGILGLFSFIFGMSQYTINNYPWALWITGTVALFAVALYIISQIGQKLGVEQTFRIHLLLEDALDQKIQIT